MFYVMLVDDDTRRGVILWKDESLEWASRWRAGVLDMFASLTVVIVDSETMLVNSDDSWLQEWEIIGAGTAHAHPTAQIRHARNDKRPIRSMN